MKRKLMQYISLILIIAVLWGIILPLSTYATTYLIDFPVENSTIEEGMLLISSNDQIQVSSNLHADIFLYEYGYSGEYDGTNSTGSTWSMSGQYYDIGSTSESNRVWEVKKIDTNGDIHLQEVDAINIATVENESVLNGNDATFEVIATPKVNVTLNYQWYRTGTGINQELQGETNSTLVIEPEDDAYINGAQFYCKVYDSNCHPINTVTNTATLSINEGYTITYKSMDGTETIKTDTQKYVQGAKVSLDFTNILTKENCEFLGWATSANSDTATYATVENKLIMPSSNVTLYAVWNKTKLIDNPTNTTLIGKFNYNAILTVTKMEDDDTKCNDIKLKLDEASREAIASYEVTITGTYTGDIEIVFYVDEKYNGKEITIYHQKADNTIEILKATASEGKVKITVSELSPFVLAVDKTDTISTNPQTGDNILILIGVLTIATIGFVSTLVIKKKNK